MSAGVIVAIVLGVIVGVLMLLYFLISIGVVIYIQIPKKLDFEFLVEHETKEKGFKKEWLDIRYEPMEMVSKYGYKLFGRFYRNPKPTNKVMLSLHGHNSCSVSQMKYLNMFLDLGFNVFMPDHRRSGFSDGKSITFGHYEKYDVISWIDKLEKIDENFKFYIFGESMGAATAILVTSLDKRINLLISYCGYYDMKNIFKGHLKNKHLLNFIYPGIKLMSRLITKTDFNECSAGKAMKKVKVPTLVIHSEGDQLVIFENAKKMLEANPDAEHYFFKDTAHARSMVKYPEKFTEVVSNFVNSHLEDK